MTTYDGVDNFPKEVVIPDDGADWRLVVAGMKQEGDRTTSLNTTRVFIANLSALKAIDTSALADGIVRSVVAFGCYTFDRTSTQVEITPRVVQPITGPGRWIADEPNTLSYTRVVSAHESFDAYGLSDLNTSAIDFKPYTPGDLSINSYDRGAVLARFDTGGGVIANSRSAFKFSLNEHLVDGATLTSVVARYRHSVIAFGNFLPQFRPAFGVFRLQRNPDGFSIGVPEQLYTIGGFHPTTDTGFSIDPTTDPQIYNHGPTNNAEHSWSCPCNQKNVIDLEQYEYYVIAFAEYGSNVIAFPGFVSFALQMSGQLTLMRAGPLDDKPIITSITPSSGTSAGGTAVTIKGSRFQVWAIDNVRFVSGFLGTAILTSVVVVDDQTITAVTPAHAAGAYTPNLRAGTTIITTDPGHPYTYV